MENSHLEEQIVLIDKKMQIFYLAKSVTPAKSNSETGNLEEDFNGMIKNYKKLLKIFGIEK